MARKMANAEKKTLIEASTVTRLLIVSFFIALSLGLIEGADIKLLATPFLPEHLALWSMRGLMLALSVMVLVGFHRRPAALILALMVFWPSYMTLFAGGDVSAFWRDLALIGGLIMTAAEPAKEAAQAAEKAEETPHAHESVTVRSPKVAAQQATDQAYREDFNLVRSA